MRRYFVSFSYQAGSWNRKRRVVADTRLSDHVSFWDRGIPALMVTDTAYFRNRNYHGPGDRAETMDYVFMAAQYMMLGAGEGHSVIPSQKPFGPLVVPDDHISNMIVV